jgi:hypothetical protein
MRATVWNDALSNDVIAVPGLDSGIEPTTLDRRMEVAGSSPAMTVFD